MTDVVSKSTDSHSPSLIEPANSSRRFKVVIKSYSFLRSVVLIGASASPPIFLSSPVNSNSLNMDSNFVLSTSLRSKSAIEASTGTSNKIVTSFLLNKALSLSANNFSLSFSFGI